MNCNFKEKLAFYFYGELSEKEVKALKEHILTCPLCQNDLKELQNISNFLDFKTDISPKIVENIISYSESKLEKKFAFSLREKVFSFAFSFAVILLFLIPFTNKTESSYSVDVDEKISSLENKLIAFKYDLMDTTEYDFEYKISNIDTADIEKIM